MPSDSLDTALYEISEAVNTSDDLIALYRRIHQSLNKVIDANNFYIALYDATEDLIHFPYWQDELSPNRQLGSYRLEERRDSISALVIKNAKPMIFSRQQLIHFWNQQGCSYQEPVCEIWLGVPLMIKQAVIGIITLQHYSDPFRYSEKDIALLKNISDQIAVAIDRKISQTRFRNLIENIKDAVYLTNPYGRITYVSPASESVIGIASEELTGTYRWVVGKPHEEKVNAYVHPEDRRKVTALIEKSVNHHCPFEIEYRILEKDGKARWVLERGQIFRDDMGHVFLEGIISDIQERKRAELINQALYHISEAVNTTRDLNDLYLSIHDAIQPVIEVEHMGVGLYDAQKDILTFSFNIGPEGVEHPLQVENASQSASLNAEVVRQARPLVFSKEQMLGFAEERGGQIIGSISESWLGVPLKVKNDIIGSIFVEKYSDSRPYTQEDIDCMALISDQIAIAIERKRAEEQILFREKMITTLYKISNAMHTTQNLNQLYQSIHEALKPVMNVDNFSISLYDKQKDRLNFQYSADQVDPHIFETIENASQSRSLTFYVIKTGKAVLLRENEMAGLQEKLGGSNVKQIRCKNWMGVPLKGKTSILGAIINQSYSDPDCFQQRDIDLLEAISDQVGIAIEYKRAEADLMSAQTELVEKAHKAGMADIASDTIHNLGNILNSVKTSNELVNGMLNQTTLSGLKKAADYLREHIDHLKAFIQEDPNGIKLMKYILSIEEVLHDDFEAIREQSKRITRKIELMTNVIRTQQNYVYEGAIEEKSTVADILNRILDMYENSLMQFGIEIERDFETVPPILVQRTKLTHIFINLIDNAKDALRFSPDTDKKLSVSLYRNGRDLHVVFKDNGAGILTENLSRIFSHGFTTKPQGHGFGLHNCANLASEMKARLWAESKGPGQGASFFLKLPMESDPS